MYEVCPIPKKINVFCMGLGHRLDKQSIVNRHVIS